MAIELLIEVLDIARILTDQHGGEIFDGASYRPGLPLQRCLSPAKKPCLVSNDLYEDPIAHFCVDDDGLYIGNFHRASPGKWGDIEPDDLHNADADYPSISDNVAWNGVADGWVEPPQKTNLDKTDS